MTKDANAELSSLEDCRCAAMINGDIAVLSELFSSELVWTHASAHQDSRESFLAKLQAGGVRYLSIERSEEKIRLRGETAVITGVADMRAIVRGEEMVLRNRYLDVWTHEDGQWRMLAWQSTSAPRS